MKRAALTVGLVLTLIAVPVFGQAADAPDASADAPRSWLSNRGSSTPLELATRDASPSPWRSGALIFVLAGLGGAALWLRTRRKGRAVKQEVPALRVVASTRIGPKAQVVVTRVGGRDLLLGVTEHSVQKLAWLEPLPDSAPESAMELASEPEGAARDAWEEPLASPAASRAPALSTRQQSEGSGFRDVLMTALGRPGAAPEATPAAVALAAETEDRYVPSRRRSEMVEVESQAAGLIARLDGLS
ncbi:MAG: flagellar biosynthetic protein FliO [Polyangiaceae bacterium]